MEIPKDSPGREESRELKTFTLRMPLDLHRHIEIAARMAGRSLNQFISDAAEAAARQSGNATVLPAAPVELPVMLAVDLDSFAGRASINVQALETLAATVVPPGAIGRTVLKSSYCTGLAAEVHTVRTQLLARHIRHEELASRDALRLRMMAACLIAMADLNVRNIVLVTADEEFAFLATVLKERGGALHAVWMKSEASNSPGLIGSFDSFRRYDALDKPPKSEELQQLRRKYAELLVQIAYGLEQRGAKPVGATLVPVLRYQHPELKSLELLELHSFRDLADFAKGEGLLSEVADSGTDFLPVLSEQGRSTAQRLLERADADMAQRTELERISNAIEQIIGTTLPSVSTRFVLFSTVQWALSELGDMKALNLVELSYRVADRLGSAGVTQNTAYRLLNGLYRAGVFEVQSNPANENDPRVLRARVPGIQFDDAFVLNLMRLRGRFPTQADPKMISLAVYGSDEHARKVQQMLRVAADSRYTRSNLQEALHAIRGDPG